MTITSLAALAAVLLAAPLLPGIAAKTAAILTGRRGSPLLQLYRDLGRLRRKDVVRSATSTWISRLAPPAVLGAALLAACLLPLDGRAAPVGFTGDLIVFAGLLALGRFLLALGGLDTGSSFVGMGVSRVLAFGGVVEPALFISFAVLAMATGSLSLSGMLGPAAAVAWSSAPASLSMAGVSLFVLLLAEASRGPVDDPATHLELTMIHEVTILDSSGPDLALFHYGSALHFALFASMVVAVLVPRGTLAAPLAIGVLLVGMGAVAVLVGVLETSMARLRLLHVPHLLIGASALATLGLLLLLR